VKLGEGATRAEYAVLALAPFVLAILLGTLWPLLALPALLPALRTVLTQEGPALNRGLGETARAQILYSLLLAAGLWQ
jgi:1,4-dihydroxy-2-naphthoate octaprenyltransferase